MAVKKSGEEPKPAQARFKPLDALDVALMSILQRRNPDSWVELAKWLADETGQSMNPRTCSDRVEALRTGGYILNSGYVLNAKKLGCGQLCFMHAKLKSKTPEDVARFAAAVNAEPHIQEVHSMLGEYDYLMKVRVHNIEEALAISERFAADGLADIETSAAGASIKETTAIKLVTIPMQE